MPHSVPSDIPDKFVPNSIPSRNTINNLFSNIRSITNTRSGPGVNTQSGSSGNSLNLDVSHFDKPIFAMITNVSRIVIDPRTVEVPPVWRNHCNCYGNITAINGVPVFRIRRRIIHAYSWIEVFEDSRPRSAGEEIFSVSQARNLQIGDFPDGTFDSYVNPVTGHTIHNPFPPYCLRIGPVSTVARNFGNLRRCPAFDINNHFNWNIGPGCFVEMYRGMGNYMLFSSPRETTRVFNNAYDEDEVDGYGHAYNGNFHDWEQPYLPDEDFP